MIARKNKETVKGLLTAALIGALFMGGVRLFFPRTYTSSAAILFPASSGTKASAGAGSSSSGQAGPAAGSARDSGADQPALPIMEGLLTVPQPGTSPGSAALILTSRKTTTEMIKRFKLDKEWHLSMDKAITRFHHKFKCISGSSGDLKITFVDYRPERAKNVVTAAIEILEKSVEELSLDPAARNLEFLRSSLKDAEISFAKTQKGLVAFQQRIGGNSPEIQMEAVGQIYREINGDLIKAEAEKNAARANAGALTSLSERMVSAAQDPAGNADSLLSDLYRQTVARETELSLLRRKYTDRQPEVVQARQAGEETRRKLALEVKRQLAGVRSGASPVVVNAVVNATASSARADGLRRAANNLRGQLRSLPAQQAQYEKLLLDYEAEKSRLTLVRGEYEKAALMVRSRGMRFVVFDPPVIPERPDNRKVELYAMIGFLLGIVALGLRSLVGWSKAWINYDYKAPDK